MSRIISNKELTNIVADRLGLDSQLQQLTEECAELIQAVNKHWRAEGKGQPLRPGTTKVVVQENLIKELADVKVVLEQVIHLLGCSDDIEIIINSEMNRIIEQIGIPVNGLPN